MWHTMKQFYNSKQWNDVRKVVIAQRSQKTNGNIICEYCGKVISTFGDVEVDHIKELTKENVNDVNISLNPDNLKIACHECHNKKHGRFTNTNKKVFLVYGAPFSGKSSYVKQHMTRGDIVVSFDRLFEAVSFLPQYDKPSLLSYNVFALKNHLFDQIKTRYGKFKNAWVIGGYANKHDRETAVKELGAELIYMQTTKEECLKRLEYCNKTIDDNDDSVIIGEELLQCLKNCICDLEDNRYIYDMKKAHKRIDFIQKFVKHTKSPFHGKPFLLELWEKAVIEVFYSFYFADTKIRRFKKLILLDVIYGIRNVKTVYSHRYR